jgi:hypothetical protein
MASNWLQAHEATLLECAFQMVGSIKATKKPRAYDFSNEDIIDELISTFQKATGPNRSRQEQGFCRDPNIFACFCWLLMRA